MQSSISNQNRRLRFRCTLTKIHKNSRTWFYYLLGWWLTTACQNTILDRIHNCPQLLGYQCWENRFSCQGKIEVSAISEESEPILQKQSTDVSNQYSGQWKIAKISKIPTQPSIFALSVFLSKSQKILEKSDETVVNLHLTHFYCHDDEFSLLWL